MASTLSVSTSGVVASLKVSPISTPGHVKPRQSAPCNVRKSQFVISCEQNDDASKATGRREVILQSSGAALLASVFHFSGTRPSYLGFKRNPPSLALCPPTPNCISTAEEINDPGHYVPAWNYAPEDGRARKGPVSQKQALEELVEVIESTKPDDFTPKIVTKSDNYLYVEYESPLMGFVDDVEFWFPPGGRPIVEYRSASRLGESDLDANRKRIKFLRQELQKKGWQSVGF
eukprot:TRINITY_DN22852_c0_g1_i1.p1 TRINITY_DN22852_c0_g1~~TRINITY_DN22852_c0_g1_i1.p1  ORF type:complete len:232 (-),score=43.21 TRINITY_DN22852_c0_g1_i1:389-1084(-)